MVIKLSEYPPEMRKLFTQVRELRQDLANSLTVETRPPVFEHPESRLVHNMMDTARMSICTALSILDHAESLLRRYRDDVGAYKQPVI